MPVSYSRKSKCERNDIANMNVRYKSNKKDRNIEEHVSGNGDGIRKKTKHFQSSRTQVENSEERLTSRTDQAKDVISKPKIKN